MALTSLCDGRIINQTLEDFGTACTIRVLSGTDYNNYGDRSNSYSDQSVTGFLHSFVDDDREVKEGQYNGGDTFIIFKTTDKEYVKVNNWVQYDSEWYRITNVNKGIASGSDYVVEARVQKGVWRT